MTETSVAENFSEKVTVELLKVIGKSSEEMLCELAAWFLSGGKPLLGENQMPYYLHSSHPIQTEKIHRLVQGTGGQILAEAQYREGQATGWHVIPIPTDTYPVATLMLSCLDEESIDAVTSSPPLRRAALRGFLLGCGAVSNPHKTYRMDFFLQDKRLIEYLILLLHAEDVRPLLSERPGKTSVYIRDGQAVSDVLALTGAFASVVVLEDLRVDREFQANINRLVNCDSANAVRQAIAGAEQMQWMQQLLSDPSISLPEELEQTARMRIENPGLSLRDVGAIMVPPVSKSGINHRIRRLAQIYEDSLRG